MGPSHAPDVGAAGSTPEQGEVSPGVRVRQGKGFVLTETTGKEGHRVFFEMRGFELQVNYIGGHSSLVVVRTWRTCYLFEGGALPNGLMENPISF